MNQIYYIGVDISKEKVDIAVIDQNYQVLIEKVVSNQDIKLKSFLNSLAKKFKTKMESFLICCEETGIYKMPLQRSCIELGCSLWIEQALKIKRASTKIRGKSDRQDALMIADYACRYADKKIIYQAPEKTNTTLQTLSHVRVTIMGQILRFKQQLTESKRFDKEKYAILKEHFQASLNTLKRQLSKVDKDINEVIKGCAKIAHSVKLLSSIPGVGPQTSLQVIIVTQNFKTFTTAKHLACYAGVAPFPNESGTIIKRAKVSKFANKKLKTIIHMAALACIRTKGDLKDYYIRKVKEGKNKMLVLNNLRNKLINRMFAVIHRNSEYVPFNLETRLAS